MKELSEREEILMAKAIDGTLSPNEKEEFEYLISHKPVYSQEWESSRNIKEVINTMKIREPEQETWDRYWASVYARMERGLAWLFITLGAVIVIGYGMYEAVFELIKDPQLPLLMKTAIALLLFGLAILLVSIAREKWLIRKSDKYKGVKR